MTASLLCTGLLDAPAPWLADHLTAFGPLPSADAVEVATTAGLTGRGGAGFPTATKLRSVAAAARAARRAPVVVGNGAEGEPAAAKDPVLLTHAPHLVLDGLALVARTLGAETVVLAAAPPLLPALADRLAERPDGPSVRLYATADRFLPGGGRRPSPPGAGGGPRPPPRAAP